jgi:hypothetical protein
MLDIIFKIRAGNKISLLSTFSSVPINIKNTLVFYFYDKPFKNSPQPSSFLIDFEDNPKAKAEALKYSLIYVNKTFCFSLRFGYKCNVTEARKVIYGVIQKTYYPVDGIKIYVSKNLQTEIFSCYTFFPRIFTINKDWKLSLGPQKDIKMIVSLIMTKPDNLELTPIYENIKTLQNAL